MPIRFGQCCLETDTRQLTRNGEPVPISPKAFQLLEFLLQHRPKALSSRELYRHLWPDTFVEKANLRNLIAEIRAATHDRGPSPRLIRTVFGFGYSFVGEAREEPTGERLPSRYQLFYRASPYPLFEGENVVGREAGATVVIDARGISRRHALLLISGEQILLEDLASKNGTFVDGERVRERVPVEEGAEIRFGHLTTRIRAIASDGSTLTEL